VEGLVVRGRAFGACEFGGIWGGGRGGLGRRWIEGFWRKMGGGGL
jgi:hypothetical protein